MTLSERFIRLTENHRGKLGLLTIVLLSVGVGYYRGLSTLLLFFAFCFLTLALYLLWSTLTSLGEPERMSVDEALEYAALTHDEERKTALLRALKDLEYEQSLGKISEEDYATLSLRYRKEARHLLEQLDSADASLRQRVQNEVAKRLGDEP